MLNRFQKWGKTMPNVIDLPEVKILQMDRDEANEWPLVIAGGRAPEINWLQVVAVKKRIYCADHGLDICLQAGLKPVYVLGDGDSACAKSWQWAKDSGIPLCELPRDKDYTDTQLILKMLKKDYSRAPIMLTGGWGGRFDHLYSTLFSLSNMVAKDYNICVGDDKEMMLYLHNERVEFKCSQIPLSISFIPFTESCNSVSVNGTKWPLKKSILLQNQPNATSNVLAAGKDSFTVKNDEGVLGVYICWQEFKM